MRRTISHIETALAASLPDALAGVQLADPAYALLLCWFDFTVVDDFRPVAVVAGDAIRKREDADSTRIWSPQHEFPELVVELRLGDESLGALVRSAYGLMSGHGEGFSGGVVGNADEERGRLLPFREMMLRLARRLNRERPPLTMTDDFVVLASSWDGEIEDPKACMSREQFARLKASGNWFEEEAKEEAAVARFVSERLAGLSEGRQAEILVEQYVLAEKEQLSAMEELGLSKSAARYYYRRLLRDLGAEGVNAVPGLA